jgi:type VI secretion system secreted protein VgrG
MICRRSRPRSTVKSQSSKGGDGFNELRFEDKKGSEEVFVHAERDFLRVVKNNDTLKVGFETADKGDQTIDIKNDQALTIGHDQAVKIDGKQEVKVATTIVIEAGTSIELKVGGSSIKIEAAKITVKSPEIEIAADANAKLKAGAMMEIKSGAVMTIGGALVQIN